MLALALKRSATNMCLPNSSCTGGHDQHTKILVICEVFQYLLPFCCWTVTVNTLEVLGSKARIGHVGLNQIQGPCPTREDNAAYY